MDSAKNATYSGDSSQGSEGILTDSARQSRLRRDGMPLVSLIRCLGRLYDDNLALYGKRYYYYIWELPVFVAMGCAAGLLGAAFIRLNILATQLRARFIPPRKPLLRLLEVTAVVGSPRAFSGMRWRRRELSAVVFGSGRPALPE